MSNIRVIQLSNYTRPKIEENKSKDWVLNGKNNDFYKYVIDRYNGSPTNATIINNYVNLIYGRGLYATNARTNVQDWVKLKQVLKAQDVRRIVMDFEMFGEASFQVIETKGKELSSIKHIPKEKLAPSIANDENEIESYWFSNDWADRYKEKNRPVDYPAFDGAGQSTSIYNIKPYKSGKEYFADPDYLAGLPYATMEEEIANYYVNHIKNGLSFGYIINIPDGIDLTEEEQEELERKFKGKLTGSNNAGKFVMSFNGRDAEITVTKLDVNDAHKQWEFLTQEARQQLITAHGVTSPMLFGIKDNTGLGNNAEELDTAEAQMIKRVVRPKGQYITDALEDVLYSYGINLDLYFLPLTEVEQNSVELSKQPSELDLFISKGEVIDMELYDEVYNEVVDYDNDNDNELLQLASTGTARPNARSEQDSEDILIRYKYVGNANPEREFCSKMMQADKVYRKEDIIQLDNKPVNAGFGMDGADTYSIWLYKGGGLLSDNFPGGTCKHKWNRVIYLRKGVKPDLNSPLAQTISTSEARRRGYDVPTNDSIVSIAPHDVK